VVNIRILRSFVASAEQQDHLRTSDGVVDPIARPDVDSQFSDSVAAKLVIAKAAQFHPVDSAIDSNFRFRVAKLTTPFHKEVFVTLCEVMTNLVHD
jgi:hypothetical protein